MVWKWLLIVSALTTEWALFKLSNLINWEISNIWFTRQDPSKLLKTLTTKLKIWSLKPHLWYILLDTQSLFTRLNFLSLMQILEKSTGLVSAWEEEEELTLTVCQFPTHWLFSWTSQVLLNNAFWILKMLELLEFHHLLMSLLLHWVLIWLNYLGKSHLKLEEHLYKNIESLFLKKMFLDPDLKLTQTMLRHLTSWRLLKPCTVKTIFSQFKQLIETKKWVLSPMKQSSELQIQTACRVMNQSFLPLQYLILLPRSHTLKPPKLLQMRSL